MTTPDIVSVELEDLGVLDASALALSADGTRCYVGVAAGAGHLREHLGVVSLDPAGKPVGTPRWYRVTDEDLPLGAQLTVQQILPHPHGTKLYLALSRTGVELTRTLIVLDLVGGEPDGGPRAFDAGLALRHLNAMALHPDRSLLYAVGNGSQNVAVHALREDGEPTGILASVAIPATGAAGKHDVAVNDAGTRLYLGAFPETLQVVNLDGAGMPLLNPPPRQLPAGAGPDGLLRRLRFTLTPRALYRRRSLGAPAGPWKLQYWRLDPNGEPVGQLVTDDEMTAASVLAGRDGVLLLRDATNPDALTGQDVFDGSGLHEVKLTADGEPGSATRVAHLARRTCRVTGLLTVAAGTGRAAALTRPFVPGFVRNEVAGWRFRITAGAVSTTAGPVPPSMKLRYFDASGGAIVHIADLAQGASSDWKPLDARLAGVLGRRMLTIEVRLNQANPPPIDDFGFTIEVADGDPQQGGAMLRTMTERVAGEKARILLPGYDLAGADDRADRIMLLSDYAKRLEAVALAVALPEDRRPRRFPVGCFAVQGTQGQRDQLAASVRAVRALGINTANVFDWGRIPGTEVGAVLEANGLTWRSGAYNGAMPFVFSFDANPTTLRAMAQWAQDRVTAIAEANGARPDQIIDFKILDEPAFFYPAMDIHKPDHKRLWLPRFREYLAEQGLQPVDVGATDWSEVFPISRGQVGPDAESRRLFRATTRFLSESAAEGMKLARAALLRALGHRATVETNNNLLPARWFVPHPGDGTTFKNPDNDHAGDPEIGPSLALGWIDWPDAGRRSAVTQWSNVVFPDDQAQGGGYLAEILRSAAAGGDAGWGCYLKANVLGTLPSGPRYKLLSLAGRGADIIDLYTYGPNDPANGWSDSTERYPAIASAIGLIGAAEDHFIGAVPAAASVALLSPVHCGLWDADRLAGLYQSEVEQLHAGLVHAGYAVDIVDEHDLASGALRRYRALYVTAPNLFAAAAAAVADWVQAGGVLAVTPGAATADELDRPSTALDPVLGLTDRARDRFKSLTKDVQRIEFTPDFVDGADPSLEAFKPVTTLTGQGAQTVASFAPGGGAAVTVHRHGRGSAIGYGYFPGLAYQTSADRSRTTRLPAGWGPTHRAAATAAARIAGAARPVVVDVAGVEALRLDRAAGGTPPSAVTLLNWTGAPLPDIAVTIPHSTASRVRSALRGALTVAPDPATAGIRVSLPLPDVDVLLLD